MGCSNGKLEDLMLKQQKQLSDLQFDFAQFSAAAKRTTADPAAPPTLLQQPMKALEQCQQCMLTLQLQQQELNEHLTKQIDQITAQLNFLVQQQSTFSKALSSAMLQQQPQQQQLSSAAVTVAQNQPPPSNSGVASQVLKEELLRVQQEMTAQSDLLHQQELLVESYQQELGKYKQRLEAVNTALQQARNQSTLSAASAGGAAVADKSNEFGSDIVLFAKYIDLQTQYQKLQKELKELRAGQPVAVAVSGHRIKSLHDNQ